MNPIESLKQDGYFCTSRKMAREIGFLETSLLHYFADLQYNFFGGKEFYQQKNRILKDLNLSERVLERLTKKLVDLNLLSVIKKGMPAKNYYKINGKSIIEMLNNDNKSEQVSTKRTECKMHQDESTKRTSKNLDLTKTKTKEKIKDESFTKNEFFENESISFSEKGKSKKKYSQEELEHRAFIRKIYSEEIIPKYPIMRRGSKDRVINKLYRLSEEEFGMVLKNLERYLSLSGEYVAGLERFLQEKMYTPEWLDALEKQNKKILQARSKPQQAPGMINGINTQKVPTYNKNGIIINKIN